MRRRERVDGQQVVEHRIQPVDESSSDRPTEGNRRTGARPEWGESPLLVEARDLRDVSDRLAGGYPPSEVAEQVVAGIREGRFYIVPAQPDVKDNIAIRAQDLLELRNPTLRRG